MVYLYSEISDGNKKEMKHWYILNMDEPWKYSTWWKKRNI